MEAAILLKDLSPLHATQTQVLLNGSGSLQFQVEHVRKGFPGARYADRFSVLVPCCLDYIKWDIIFNIEHPLHAPDIIFPPEDEKFQAALLDSETLVNAHVMWTNLQDWNMRDSSKLFTLVADLSRMGARCIGNIAPLLDNSSGGILGSKQVKNQKLQRLVMHCSGQFKVEAGQGQWSP
ncbi:hypothetical protein L7F22_035323 [Adiantum nelumboides]|nr:hypothetical protein [Adiantum nelumboides]